MLKDKASDATIKANQEKKMVEMEAERDWFRQEALDLNKINKELKDRNRKLTH